MKKEELRTLLLYFCYISSFEKPKQEQVAVIVNQIKYRKDSLEEFARVRHFDKNIYSRTLNYLSMQNPAETINNIITKLKE